MPPEETPVEMNPSFSVEIAVGAAYRFDPLKAGEEAPEGAVVVETASGPCVRNLLDFTTSERGFTVTTVGFGADSITSIQRDRAAANLPKKSISALVAEHIQDAAMRDHAPREHWLAVRCKQNPALESALKGYFELMAAWPEADPPEEPAPAETH